MIVKALKDRGHHPTKGPWSVKFTGAGIDLKKYDAVVLLNNHNWNQGSMPTTGQRALIRYVEQGGGLVTGEWLIYNMRASQSHLELEPLMPATWDSWNSAGRTTYNRQTVDEILNQGLPEGFDFLLGNIGGAETFLKPKERAITYYSSSNSKAAGLVGWDYQKGRVLSFSTFISSVELESEAYRRLFINAVERAALQTPIGSATDSPAKALLLPPLLRFSMADIDGKNIALSKYQGKVLLIVNVASQCGNTPQYQQLEALHEKYASHGLALLGIPCNDFGGQEPGSNAQIREFCTKNYSVKIDLFSKVSVKVASVCDLYKFLTSKQTNPRFAGELTWNFEKFLVNRQGEVVARFAPMINPDAPDVIKAIGTELARP